MSQVDNADWLKPQQLPEFIDAADGFWQWTPMMHWHHTSPLFPPRLLLVMFLALTGCRSLPPRNPTPRTHAGEAIIPGIPNARFWGDDVPDVYNAPFDGDLASLKNESPAWFNGPHTYLALSGGGPMGAYGAGVLTGMTEGGDRPSFLVVTGISAGALMAPFAFLGPEYDPVLREVFTGSDTEDILKFRGPFYALSKDAFANSLPLQEKIATHVTESLIQQIAAEHRKGRRLLIGTTDLDTERPVVWNIGAIADSDHPKALDLIRDILLASASIPGIFPPVLFEVEADGQPFDELHADGGMTHTIFLYPAVMDWDTYLDRLGLPASPTLYLIQNMYVQPSWRPTERKTLPIAIRGFLTMLRSQGIGDLQRIAALARRDEIRVKLTYIPPDFTQQPEEVFDPDWMSRLFELGRQVGRSGAWDSELNLVPDEP